MERFDFLIFDYLSSFNHCIELDCKDTQAWNNKGLLLENLGRYEEALEA